MDVLESEYGIAYRRNFFPVLSAHRLSNSAESCRASSGDVWVAGYLATVMRVPRMVTPGPWDAAWTLESVPAGWKDGCCCNYAMKRSRTY